MTKSVTQSQFTDKFLILRAVLCLLVFGTHIPKQLWDIRIGNATFNLSLLFSGHLAVVIFMILSGYLIGKQFTNHKYELNVKGLKKYYKSRLIRIFSIYYISIIIGLVFASPSFWANSNWFIKLLQSFLFFYDIDSAPYFVNGFWSLSVEMQFYLFAPFIFWVLTLLFRFIKVKTNLIILQYQNYNLLISRNVKTNGTTSFLLKNTNLIFFVVTTLGLFLSDFLIRRFVVSGVSIPQLRHFLLHINYLIFGVTLNFVSEPMLHFFNKLNTTRRVFAFWALFSFIIIALIDQNFRSISNSRDAFDGFIFIYFLSIQSGVLILLGETINVQKRNFIETNFVIQGWLEKLGLISYPFYLIHLIVIKSLPIQTPFLALTNSQ